MIEPGRRLVLLLLVGPTLAPAGGCITANNYTETTGPRSVSRSAVRMPEALRGDTVLVGTFNIENGEKVDEAVRVLLENPNLGTADVLLLQEVDAEATRRIARALEMAWVYYPAREREEQGFGNAVLSRWPIVKDAKLILPHDSWFGGTQRTATMAVVQIQGVPVRVYSTHLATPVNQSPGNRRDQLRTILEDADDDFRVIIGGDLNSGSVPEVALDYGYAWPTREGPSTVFVIRADHILFKGFERITGGEETGTILENREASDHRPVWARALLPSGAGNVGALPDPRSPFLPRESGGSGSASSGKRDDGPGFPLPVLPRVGKGTMSNGSPGG